MQKHLIAAALFIGLAAMIGCSNNNDEDPTLPENPGQQMQKADTTLTPTRTAQHYPSLVSTNGDFALTSEQQTSVRKNNAFALRLFNTIAPDGQSTVFSPLSLTLALAFCADGSTGQTREEIMTTLGLDDSQPNSVNELCATLIQNTMKADTATTFNIANAFFLNSAWGFTLLPDYTERLHGYYDADIEALDFNYPSSKEHINAWGKRQTNGMIPNVLEELQPTDVACLLNAIYMDARWQKQFAKEMTRNEAFHPGGGKADITLPMMHQTYHFRYVETEDYQALRMNYGTEGDRNATFGMTIVLPKDGRDIADIRSSMTSDELDAVAQTQYLWDVNVALPRFTTDVRTGLTNPLMELGIRQAFDVRNAQFPGIVRQTNLFISDIFQKARIEVAEKGTKAAAITVIHMAATSIGMEPPKPKDFIADRPFLYYITESRTGAIYFMGQFCGE